VPASSDSRGLRVRLSALTARHPAAGPSAPRALELSALDIAPGEQVAVIGPSGAGKTTLLHVIACALRPERGRLQLDDEDPWALSVASLHRLRSRLFLAPQTPPLPPRQRTITALLAARLPRQSLWQSLRSLVHPLAIEEAHDALHRFDLGEKLWTRVDRLSGGERQRVGLARALLAPADLWLVDEPLSALDPTRAAQAIDTLVGAAAERGATLVATLHQVDVAVARFPRIIGLRDGKIAFDSPSGDVSGQRLRQLYAQHEHELAGVRDASLPAGPTEPPMRGMRDCR
jgi:phosphonate transport system ATP-binding protein